MPASSPSAYNLRFRIHLDAPASVQRRYDKIYGEFAATMFPDRAAIEPYLLQWIARLSKVAAGTSVDWQLLDRAEGGIGGGNNVTDRQIRPFCDSEHLPGMKFKEITFSASDSSDGTAVWTLAELREFVGQFELVLAGLTGAHDAVDTAVIVDW